VGGKEPRHNEPLGTQNLILLPVLLPLLCARLLISDQRRAAISLKFAINMNLGPADAWRFAITRLVQAGRGILLGREYRASIPWPV